MDLLKRRLANGDSADFAELYDAIADGIFHYLVTQTGTREDAADLLQETFFGMESYRGFNSIARRLGSDWIEYLDFMEHQIEMGDKSAFEMGDAVPGPRSALASLVTPAIEAARNGMNRVRALSRCVRIVNALYAREMDDDSVELDSLGLPPNALIDPFTGNQLRHERTSLGWVMRTASWPCSLPAGAICRSSPCTSS